MARKHSRRAIAFTAVLALLAICGRSAIAGASPRLASTGPVRQVTITVPDGTRLSCGVVLPPGNPPAGGWPGLLLFHALGSTHWEMQAIAATYFAPRGLASLACDARGVGLSGGSFDLDGPATDKDTHYLAGWLAALPMVSNTKIGAFGWSLGGGAVWNAAAAGVPFKAIAVGAAWTSLSQALWPDGVPRNGLIASFVGSVRDAKWDPASLQALSNLVAGHVTPAATAVATVRSSRPMLHSLTVPTLIL